MKAAARRVKLVFVIVFSVLGLLCVLADDAFVPSTKAFSTGPPPGFTGAPGEAICTACHDGPSTGGTFTITPPAKYTPGQTYQLVVRHVNADPSRHRWGFQLTALNGSGNMAGSFASLNAFTQVVGGAAGRDYIEHTQEGTFNGSSTTAAWTFNWTAPASDVGPVTFYAAGNQANGDGTSSGDRIITATASSPPAAPVPSHAPFDFDGDGKTDVSIFRPAPAEWWINRSSNSQTFAAQFGASDDVIVPGDYTGDGKADIAIWRPSNGFWFILRSDDFSFFSFPFGTDGDVPVPANYDGVDNKVDPAIYRPSNNLWFISRSSGGTDISQFGTAGDLPVPADYDGDGKVDIAIYRPSLGQWWMNRSTAGVLAVTFGTSTDRTVQGDYTGDGKADNAFWRPSTGEWFFLRSEDFSFFSVPFGTSTDIPAVGDYDGDGKWDTAIFRPSETNWYVNRSTAGVMILQFGAPGDRPVPNAFVR